MNLKQVIAELKKNANDLAVADQVEQIAQEAIEILSKAKPDTVWETDTHKGHKLTHIGAGGMSRGVKISGPHVNEHYTQDESANMSPMEGAKTLVDQGIPKNSKNKLDKAEKAKEIKDEQGEIQPNPPIDASQNTLEQKTPEDAKSQEKVFKEMRDINQIKGYVELKKEHMEKKKMEKSSPAPAAAPAPSKQKIFRDPSAPKSKPKAQIQVKGPLSTASNNKLKDLGVNAIQKEVMETNVSRPDTGFGAIIHKEEHQPHPGPSKSEHQKTYDAKKQAESEAKLKTPEGDKQRKEENAKRMIKKSNPDEKADAKLGEKVEQDVEQHMMANKSAEKKEGHPMCKAKEAFQAILKSGKTGDDLKKAVDEFYSFKGVKAKFQELAKGKIINFKTKEVTHDSPNEQNHAPRSPDLKVVDTLSSKDKEADAVEAYYGATDTSKAPAKKLSPIKSKKMKKPRDATYGKGKKVS